MEQLDAVEAALAEHAQIERDLSDPAVHADAGRARRLGRRYAELGRVVQAYRAWRAAADDAQLGLAARTVDAVACGEQQPETDHRYTGTGTWTGATDDGRHWRATRERFAYRLSDPEARGAVLRVTYLAQPGVARVLVDGVAVGTLEVTDSAAGTRTVDLPLAAVVAGGVDEHVPRDAREIAFVTDGRTPSPPVVAVHLLTGAP